MPARKFGFGNIFSSLKMRFNRLAWRKRMKKAAVVYTRSGISNGSRNLISRVYR
jgi:hypothetical protein